MYSRQFNEQALVLKFYMVDVVPSIEWVRRKPGDTLSLHVISLVKKSHHCFLNLLCILSFERCLMQLKTCFSST